MIVAHIGAEIAFQCPERHDNRGGHAVLLLDLCKGRRIRLDQRLAALNAVGGGHASGKLQECLREDTLPAIDVDDVQVVSQSGRSGRDRALRNSFCSGFAFERREPGFIRP